MHIFICIFSFIIYFQNNPLIELVSYKPFSFEGGVEISPGEKGPVESRFSTGESPKQESVNFNMVGFRASRMNYKEVKIKRK